METTDVLSLLSDNETVSGESIANEFDVSRNAVWKHVERLREAGFEIESTGSGYRFVEVPEYGGLAVSYHLDTERMGRDIDYRSEVSSTNAVAKEAAREGAREGLVVLSDVQKGGKARRGRRWESPSGGVWMSVVLRPEMAPRDASVITLAASVAVARSLEDLGIEPSIKWPNDVLVGDAKICGILVEMEADAESISHGVVGIGLNANVTPDVPDVEVTSVKDELGRDVDRASLVASVLSEFEELYSSSHDEVLDEWRGRSSTLGREVKVETPRETVEGEAVGVDSTGALRVRTDDGERVITAGDCQHLR